MIDYNQFPENLTCKDSVWPRPASVVSGKAIRTSSFSLHFWLWRGLAVPVGEEWCKWHWHRALEPKAHQKNVVLKSLLVKTKAVPSNLEDMPHIFLKCSPRGLISVCFLSCGHHWLHTISHLRSANRVCCGAVTKLQAQPVQSWLIIEFLRLPSVCSAPVLLG